MGGTGDSRWSRNKALLAAAAVLLGAALVLALVVRLRSGPVGPGVPPGRGVPASPGGPAGSGGMTSPSGRAGSGGPALGSPAGSGTQELHGNRGPGVSLEGGDLVLSDPSGRVEWEMMVERVEASEASGSAWISGVRATRYIGGQRAFDVAAGQATVEWSAKKVSFSGGISAEGTSGARLDAERATWDGAHSLLELEGDVRYRDGATTLSGERLQVDESLGKARIVGRGRATVLVAR